MISVTIFPLILGAMHCFEADHLLAVASLSSNHQNKKATLFYNGVSWGVGHSLPIVIIGIIYAWSQVFLLEKMPFSLEVLVGLVLIAAGVFRLLYKTKKDKLKNHLKAILLVGLLHGFAGSAGIVLAYSSTVNSFSLQIVYLLMFSVGSIFCMGLISVFLSKTSHVLQKIKKVQYIIPLLSILYGMFMIYDNL